MNMGTIFLIKLLGIFSFCLKGAESRNEEVRGLLGHSVLLPAPTYKDTAFRIQWLMDSKLIRRVTWDGPNPKREGLEKYEILSNGSLKIDELMKNNSGDYKVEGLKKDRTPLFTETTVTLLVVEPLPLPQLSENCDKRTVSCEMKINATNPLTFKLFQDNQERKNLQAPTNVKGTWKVTLTVKETFFSGKFKCEVGKQHTEKKINCSGPASSAIDMYVYLIIGGGGVILSISLALIIYCIRKKRAVRREVEDQERELQVRIVDDELKHRKLPQPPVHAVPNQPHQQQRPPPPRSELQQQGGPPQPRPRPHPHQKPPRHMKERP